MAELWNKRQRRTQVVPDAEVLDAVKTGNYAIPQGLVSDNVVTMRGDNGRFSVPVGSVYDMLAKGYRLETGWQKQQAEEIKAGEERQATIDRFAPIAAGASQFASTATLGISDVLTSAAEKLGVTQGGATESVAKMRAEHPIASAVGGVAGAVVPVGAAGAIAKLGRAAIGATSATRGVQALKAGGLGAKTLAAALEAGAAGVAEGAAYGAGQGVSEYALGNSDNLAESLAANVTLGGVIGGAFGAGLGAVGKVSEAGIRKASTLLRKAADKVAAESSPMPFESEAALRSFGLTRNQVKKLAKSTGAKELGIDDLNEARLVRIINRVKETKTPDGDDVITKLSSPSELSRRLAKVVDKAGDDIGSALGQADDAMASSIPGTKPISRQVIIDRIRKEVIDEARGMPGSSSVRSEAESLISDISEKSSDMGFKEAHKFRLRMTGAWERQGKSVVNEAQRKMERIIADEIDTSLDVFSKDLGLGDDFFQKYRHAKDVYSDLRMFSTLSSDRAKELLGNNWIPLTSTIVGSASGVSGGIGPGLIAGAVTKAAKSRGWSTAYSVARNTSVVERIQSAVNAVDDAISAVSSTFIDEAVRAPRTATGPITSSILSVSFGGKKDDKSNIQDAAKARYFELADLMANPERLADRLSMSMVPLEADAPQAAERLGAIAANAIKYLYEQAPKPPQGPKTLLDKWKPTKAEAATFARRVAAANNPLIVLESIKRRMVSREEIETLEVLYPDMLERLRYKLAEAVGASKRPLSYDDMFELSIILNRPLRKSLSSAFVARQQEIYAGQPEPNQANEPRVTGIRRVELGNRMMPASMATQQNLR